MVCFWAGTMEMMDMNRGRCSHVQTDTYYEMNDECLWPHVVGVC